jgi:hypothetical protein
MSAKDEIQRSEMGGEEIRLAMRLFEDEKDLHRRLEKAAKWLRWYRSQEAVCSL